MPKDLKVRNEENEDHIGIVLADNSSFSSLSRIIKATEDNAEGILADISDISCLPTIAIGIASAIYLINHFVTIENITLETVASLATILLLISQTQQITEFTERKLTDITISELIRSGRSDLADCIRGILDKRHTSDQV